MKVNFQTYIGAAQARHRWAFLACGKVQSMKKACTIEDYADMLYLPHPEPSGHERMSRESRAAQFAPFAALTGYGEMIDDTAKESDIKRER